MFILKINDLQKRLKCLPCKQFKFRQLRLENRIGQKYNKLYTLYNVYCTAMRNLKVKAKTVH